MLRRRWYVMGLLVAVAGAVAFAVVGLSRVSPRPDEYDSTQGIVTEVRAFRQGQDEDWLRYEARIEFDDDSGVLVSFWSADADEATRVGDVRTVWYDPADAIATAETDADRVRGWKRPLGLALAVMAIAGLIYVSTPKRRTALDA